MTLIILTINMVNILHTDIKAKYISDSVYNVRYKANLNDEFMKICED